MIGIDLVAIEVKLEWTNPWLVTEEMLAMKKREMQNKERRERKRSKTTHSQNKKTSNLQKNFIDQILRFGKLHFVQGKDHVIATRFPKSKEIITGGKSAKISHYKFLQI